jgi:hypothetical protein
VSKSVIIVIVVPFRVLCCCLIRETLVLLHYDVGMIVLQFSTYNNYFNLFHCYLPDNKPTNQMDMQCDEACFLALHLTVLTIIWATKMNFQLRSYTRQSLWSYATANVQQSGLSFTLFWTLFYGLVYLY